MPIQTSLSPLFMLLPRPCQRKAQFRKTLCNWSLFGGNKKLEGVPEFYSCLVFPRRTLLLNLRRSATCVGKGKQLVREGSFVGNCCACLHSLLYAARVGFFNQRTLRWRANHKRSPKDPTENSGKITILLFLFSFGKKKVGGEL